MKRRPLLDFAPLLGLGGAIVLATACVVHPASLDWRIVLLRALEFAFFYWLALPLGALALLMITHLTDARWGRLAQPQLEVMAATTGIMVLVALGLLAAFFLARAHALGVPMNEARALSPHKALYLSVPFIATRAALFLAAWLALAAGLAGRLRGHVDAHAASAIGLIVLGFSVTFAVIDWQLSLSPAWFSTIYGLVILVGQALETWAFALLVVKAPSDSDAPLARDLGNILLTLVVLWTYLSFMQYLVIWSGNRPDESAWFLARGVGGWQACLAAIILFQFAAPFGALLFRQSKQNRAVLRALASGVLAARIVEQYWLVAPTFSPGRFSLAIADVAAWCAIGGLWLRSYARMEMRRIA